MDDRIITTETPEGVEISFQGGNCPVQIDGAVDGKPFYFRARGNNWTVGIGGEPVSEPEWFRGEQYSEEEFAAGWMSLDEARTFLFGSIELYRKGEPGNYEEYHKRRALELAVHLEPAFEEMKKERKHVAYIEEQEALLREARAAGTIPPREVK